jgi:hypothetical protein
MKIILILFLLISSSAIAQKSNESEDPKDVIITDEFGVSKKVKVARAHQILIIEGDSVYNFKEEYQLRAGLLKKDGFLIINDPDTIQMILKDLIKTLVIVKSKKRKSN